VVCGVHPSPEVAQHREDHDGGQEQRRPVDPLGVVGGRGLEAEELLAHGAAGEQGVAARAPGERRDLGRREVAPELAPSLGHNLADGRVRERPELDPRESQEDVAARRGGGEEHDSLPAVDEVLEPGAEGGGHAVRIVEEQHRPAGPRGDQFLEPVGGGPPRVEAEPRGEVEERLLDRGRRGYGGRLAPREELGEEGAGEGRQSHPGAGDDQEARALGKGREGRKYFVPSIAGRRIGSSRREGADRRGLVECPGLRRHDGHKGKYGAAGQAPRATRKRFTPRRQAAKRKSHRRGKFPIGGSERRHLTAAGRCGATHFVVPHTDRTVTEPLTANQERAKF